MTSGILAPVQARGNQLTGNVLGLDAQATAGLRRGGCVRPRALTDRMEFQCRLGTEHGQVIEGVYVADDEAAPAS